VLLLIAVVVWRWGCTPGTGRLSVRYLVGLLLGLIACAVAVAMLVGSPTGRAAFV